MPSLKSNIGDSRNISLDDVCELLEIISVKDDLNQSIPVEEIPRQIFCSELSINRAEFLAAGQLSFKPQLMLVVDSDEFDEETSLIFNSKKYFIYRSYPRKDGFTELYCELVVSINQLNNEIMRQLNIYTNDVQEKIKDSQEELGKEAVKELKSNSPKDTAIIVRVGG